MSANPKQNSRIYLSPPHMSGREMDYVNDAYNTNWIAPLGPNVNGFEEELCDYLGGGFAAALSSGTAAIHLALVLLDITPGDIVFCSAFTFAASANPIIYQGATPVFIDSDPETWNMCPAALATALEEANRTNQLPKALLVANIYGQNPKMSEIQQLCDTYDIPIIEDAAESLGATYQGKASGTLGKLGCFSFNGNKIITTSGGGMLVSQDKALIERARFLSTQAKEPVPYYEHQVIGYNYRMSNILAGFGRAQLGVLDERVSKRRQIFSDYVRLLQSVDSLTWMPEPNGTLGNRWLSVCLLEASDPMTVITALEQENIEARRTWKPMQCQPVFQGMRYYPHSATLSFSEVLFKKGICLPSGSALSLEDQNRVTDLIIQTLATAPEPA